MSELKLLDIVNDIEDEKQKHYIRIGELLDQAIKDSVCKGRILALIIEHAKCTYMQGRIYQEYLHKRYLIEKGELNESK